MAISKNFPILSVAWLSISIWSAHKTTKKEFHITVQSSQTNSHIIVKQILALHLKQRQ